MMDSRNFILIFLFCLSCILLQAQTETIFHQVSLNDGSVLNGKLLSEQDADPLKLELSSGTTIEIPQQSIKKIKSISTTQRMLPNGKTLNPYGFYKIIQTGFLISRDEEDDFTPILGLQVISFTLGHQFSKKYSLGGGAAWDVYDMSIFSIHADFRGYYNEEKISPYYSIQAGYGIPQDLGDNWADRIELKGGPLIHPAIGLRFARRKKTNFLLEIGYRFQWAERNDELRQRYDEIIYRRLSLRFGWKF